MERFANFVIISTETTQANLCGGKKKKKKSVSMSGVSTLFFGLRATFEMTESNNLPTKKMQNIDLFIHKMHIVYPA